jgi:molybdopterin molybdotransferase
MISVEEARGRILGRLRATGAETVGLAEAFGRVLAAPVTARVTQPPSDVSAMDGFALRAADGVVGARLRVIGEAPAGHPFGGMVGAGEAVRLFTGSFLPTGADTVLLQEDADFADGIVEVREDCNAGRHVRQAGQDFKRGDILVPAGRRLGARDVGLAAAGNWPWVTVHRRPRVAILATGEEIALPGEALPGGGIYSSNAYAIGAFVTACGGVPVILPIAGDTVAAVAAGADAARGADLLVTTGGASVGAHDVVQPGLMARGFSVDFWKIAMRPGKPLMFGDLAGMPVLGLPGNPVSAFVCAILFLAPAIEVLGGMAARGPVFEVARLAGPMKANDSREDYVRAVLRVENGVLVAEAFGVQDSGMLRTLAAADGLIRRAPHAVAAAAGAVVEVIRLGNL